MRLAGISDANDLSAFAPDPSVPLKAAVEGGCPAQLHSQTKPLPLRRHH